MLLPSNLVFACIMSEHGLIPLSCQALPACLNFCCHHSPHLCQQLHPAYNLSCCHASLRIMKLNWDDITIVVTTIALLLGKQKLQRVK